MQNIEIKSKNICILKFLFVLEIKKKPLHYYFFFFNFFYFKFFFYIKILIFLKKISLKIIKSKHKIKYFWFSNNSNFIEIQ
jgi:hypothetical protein